MADNTSMVVKLASKLLTPKTIGKMLGGIIDHVRKMEKEDGCKYILKIITQDDNDFRADIYKAENGANTYVRSYNSANIHELIQNAVNGK